MLHHGSRQPKDTGRLSGAADFPVRRLSGYRGGILLAFVFWCAGFLFAAGGEAAEAEAGPRGSGKSGSFQVMLVPEKNAFEQRRRYEYITDYLGKGLGVHVRLEVGQDYGTVCRALASGEVDAAFLGALTALLARQRLDIECLARPVGVDGDDADRGIFFTRVDSGITSVPQMAGKRLALVDRLSATGCLFQMFYLRNNGVLRAQDYFSRILHAGTHDNAAWAVYTGEADVGGAKLSIFNALAAKYHDFKEKMVVLARSPEMPASCFAVRQGMAAEQKERLRYLLLYMDKSEDGRRGLQKFGAAKFIPADDRALHALKTIVEEIGADAFPPDSCCAPSTGVAGGRAP